MNATVLSFPSAIRAEHESEEAAADRAARRARIGANVWRCNQAEQKAAGAHAREQFLAGHSEHDSIESGVSLARAMKRSRERDNPTSPSAA